MRNRFGHLVPVFGYLGRLLLIFGPVCAAPIIVVLLSREGADVRHVAAYALPAAAATLLGLAGALLLPVKGLGGREALLVCVFGWIVISAAGAAPFCILLNSNWLDAYFEAVSGFTTTGITMLSGLDALPPSILFWRALMQWLGGLGIISFFLVLAFHGGAAHALVGAESSKVFSRRPAPGLFHTLRILWFIYIFFTALIAGLLLLEGLGALDSVAHALATVSTGGHSTHDDSIAFFRGGSHNYRLIEYTIIAGMALGSINFLVHYQVMRGGFRALWGNFEMRLFWAVLFAAVVVIGGERLLRSGDGDIEAAFRNSLFHVLALSNTGFRTEDIGPGGYFGPAARQIFLALMVMGACVGSTGGGIKVLRIGILFKMVRRQLILIARPASTVAPVVVDGEILSGEEVRRVASIFFAWTALLFVGGAATALLARSAAIGPFEALSGMASALGNIGPCYISPEDMIALHPVVKIVYIFGMLAGRLEILPVLLLFGRGAWK